VHQRFDESLDELKESHSAEAIRDRLEEGPKHSNLGDFVLGAIDGAITTFAVVAGAVGADLSGGIVVVLGLANLLADGFSMGVGVFLGSRAVEQESSKLRTMIEHHVDVFPDGDRKAVRQIYAARGFGSDALEHAVTTITADRDRWVSEILHELHGVSSDPASSSRAGLVTFLAFVIVGSIPLLAFVVDVAIDGSISSPFAWSAGLTGLAFFTIGAVKSRFVTGRWWYEGLETLGVGAIAAALAYGVGVLLRGLVDSV
jgi:VIT1/CCC1 family predicted Fe2+/Mn2+ transporter